MGTPGDVYVYPSIHPSTHPPPSSIFLTYNGDGSESSGIEQQMPAEADGDVFLFLICCGKEEQQTQRRGARVGDRVTRGL